MKLILIFLFILTITNNTYSKKKTISTSKNSKSSSSMINPISIKKNQKPIINRDRKKNNINNNNNENLLNSVCFKYCINELKNYQIRDNNICFNICIDIIKLKMDNNNLTMLIDQKLKNFIMHEEINLKNSFNNHDIIKYYNLTKNTYIEFKNKCVNLKIVKIEYNNIICFFNCDILEDKILYKYENIEDICVDILYYLFKWKGSLIYNKYKHRMDELI